MASKHQHTSQPVLHELEFKVMDRLWDLGEASVRQVLDAVNRGEPKPLAYTTIMTILRRLDGKELVSRRREGKAYVYVPLWSREAASEADIARMMERYGAGALRKALRRVAAREADSSAVKRTTRSKRSPSATA